MKGIYKREEHLDPDTNDAKLKNIKDAFDLFKTGASGHNIDRRRKSE